MLVARPCICLYLLGAKEQFSLISMSLFLYYLPHPITLHTYFYSLYSRLGDLSHLGLGDGGLVLIQ